MEVEQHAFLSLSREGTTGRHIHRAGQTNQGGKYNWMIVAPLPPRRLNIHIKMAFSRYD